MEGLDLSDFFKTKEEALDFSTRLASVADKIFQTDFNLEKTLSEHFSLQMKNKLISLLHKNGVNEESQRPIKDIFDKIQTQISNLSVISLTIAFAPTEQTLQVLSEWFIMNTKKQVLFDIKTDPKILAGAVIYTNGKYMDFSLKPKFTQVLNDLMGQKELTPQQSSKETQQKQSAQAPVIN